MLYFSKADSYFKWKYIYETDQLICFLSKTKFWYNLITTVVQERWSNSISFEHKSFPMNIEWRLLNEAADWVHRQCCLSAKQPFSYIINYHWNLTTASATENWITDSTISWHAQFWKSTFMFFFFFLCTWEGKKRAKPQARKYLALGWHGQELLPSL